MPMIIFRPAIPSLAAVTLITTGTFCLAETVSFRAELSGAREVPPTQSKGTGSQGDTRYLIQDPNVDGFLFGA